MAELRIALGATADVLSSGEFSSGLAKLKDQLAPPDILPKRIMRPLAQSGILSLTTGESMTLSLGHPASGRIWVVTRINIMADDDHTALANTAAAVYVGDPVNFTLGQCVYPGITIPFTTLNNDKAIVVHDRESLFVNFTVSNTVDAQLAINALAWEYRDIDIDTQRI